MMLLETFVIMTLFLSKTSSQLINSHEYQCSQDGPLDLSSLFPADANNIKCFVCKCMRGKATCDQLQHVPSCLSFSKKPTKKHKSDDRSNNHSNDTDKSKSRAAFEKGPKYSNTTNKQDKDFNQLGQPSTTFATGSIHIVNVSLQNPIELDIE